MSLIVFADLHASHQIYAGRPGIRQDFQFALRQLLGYADQYNADVLDAGDTFDCNTPAAATVGAVQSFVHTLVKQGHRYAFILGNHSMGCWPATSPELRSSVFHVPTEGFEFDGHRVTGWDTLPRHALAEAFPAIPPDCDVLVTHQRPRELFNFNPECSMDDLPSHVKLWINGDIHVARKHENRAGQVLLSPGTPYLTGWGDDRDSGAWLLQPGQPPQRLKLIRRATVEATIENDDDLQRVIKEADHARAYALTTLPEGHRDYLAEPLVRVEYYTDEMPGALTCLEDALRSRAHVFGVPLTRASKKILASIDKHDREAKDATLLSFLADEVDAEEHPEVYATLASLLGGADVRDVCRTAGATCGLTAAELDRLVPSKG